VAQIRDIKKRIKSVTNTQKVTHAMELVSAAKMRRSQQTALSGRPYTQTLHEILANIQTQTALTHPLLKPNDKNSEMVIIISSDRGLAGGLNLNVFREILRSEIKNVKYVTIGKKARDFAAKTNSDLIASYGSEELLAIELARLLKKMAQNAFLNKEVSKVSIIYPHFESTIKQNPKWIQLLPIPSLEEILKEIIIKEEFLFEPEPKEILDVILKHHLLTEIYQALVEAKAAEHSARMVAMKNASDAAEDLVSDLTLTYNQARQEAITKELLDIITAQKAVGR
jgi:F-type H+-transporting ATPase subunit gamma